jgi:hypothetical protein
MAQHDNETDKENVLWQGLRFPEIYIMARVRWML